VFLSLRACGLLSLSLPRPISDTKLGGRFGCHLRLRIKAQIATLKAKALTFVVNAGTKHFCYFKYKRRLSL